MRRAKHYFSAPVFLGSSVFLRLPNDLDDMTNHNTAVKPGKTHFMMQRIPWRNKVAGPSGSLVHKKLTISKPLTKQVAHPLQLPTK